MTSPGTASPSTHGCACTARARTTPASAPAPASATWIGRSSVSSRHDVPIEARTPTTRRVLAMQYTATPSTTAATWARDGDAAGAATPRLTAMPRPAAVTTCPALKADLTSGRRRAACAVTVARARVPRVTSGGTRRARITKKASSMLNASDSPSRYTTTGRIQLPRTRTPIAAAMTHWRSPTRTGPDCHIATSRVRTPPATDTATTAPVACGILRTDRAGVSSTRNCSTPSRSRPGR